MKTPPWLFSIFCICTVASAQDYQYPSDPYSSTPKPQPAYQPPSTSPSYSGGGSSYGQLLTYGSLEARYNYYDYKAASLDNTSGFAVGLRAPLFKPLFLSFGLNWMSGTNQHDHSFDLTTLTAGAGAYIPITPRFHLFGEAGVRFDISDGVLSYLNPDTFAVYLRPGVRFAVTDRLELAASVLFSTTDDFNKNVVELNSYFALLSVLDIGAGIDFASDVNTYHAGLRLRW